MKKKKAGKARPEKAANERPEKQRPGDDSNIPIEVVTILNQWITVLPVAIPSRAGSGCCCCCCCGDDKHGREQPQPVSGQIELDPQLMLHVAPTGIYRAILRIEGSFSWRAPEGSRVTLEWERYSTTGARMHEFEPIAPSLANLPSTGFTRWDTQFQQTLGHRVHFRLVTDNGAASRIHWRDGTGNAGWL